MGTIYDRLSKVKYQWLRNAPTHTPIQTVDAVQDICDAAIGPGDVVPPDITLPTNMLGVTVNWNPLGNAAELIDGSIILDDDFTDNIHITAEQVANYFAAGGDLFLVNGSNLSLTVA